MEEIKKEATAGFEPANYGFADRCLSPLGHVATYSVIETANLTFNLLSRKKKIILYKNCLFCSLTKFVRDCKPILNK